MYSVSDYIKWRGDLSFEVSPFNEIDNYIVSKIGTPDFNGIIPENNTFIPLTDAVNAYFEKNAENDKKIGALSSSRILPVLKMLPDTARFSNLMLGNYRDKLDIENNEQFSALTILFPNGTRYVSFRGTDDTLAAWKENFYMAVSDCVPAQKDALEYLSDPGVSGYGKLIVGGHSKGGNLAVYSSALADASVQDRIIDIYNNDGPGFRKEFYEYYGYKRISERIHTIVSQNSIVGTLLEQDKELTVVKSSGFGISAHDGFTWETGTTSFIRCDKLSRVSESIDAAFENALASMTDDEKKDFIEELFASLTATGAVYISDFSEKKLRQAIEIAMSFKSDKKVHDFVSRVIEEMFKERKSRVLGKA